MAELTRSPLGSFVDLRDGEEKEGVWDGRGYMRAKKRKLREQFSDLDQTPASDIFSGVTIYVNGWTQPSADELKRLVHAHGGRYEYNLYGDSGVTHTIATNLPHAKIRNLKDTYVCTPNWIVDSVALGKRLPVDDYLLYSRHARGQKTLKFETRTPLATEISESTVGISCGEKAALSDGQFAPKQAIPVKRSLEDSLKPTLPRHYDATNSATFVSDYYSYSRLHYLSMWSTELKQFTCKTLPQMTQKHTKLPAETSLRSRQQRLIVHIDLDCFFVSVTLRDKPHLKGKPVAVCHAKLPKGNHHQSQHQASAQNDSQRLASSGDKISQDGIPEYLLKSMSDIASCSYEARSAGVHNGMFVGQALKLCPKLQLLPYEFDKYHSVSKLFYTILMSHSATIEAVSCDEAYIELTDYIQTVEEAESIVREIRGKIEAETGCTVSAGMAQNMLLARMATRVAKPNGQHSLSIDDADEFLGDQKVHDLPGVGYSTALKLREAGVQTCGQLRQLPVSRLKSDFGSKTGQMLYNYCRGVDDRQLKLAAERKSISVDLNFGIRFQSQSDAESLLRNLSEELEKRAGEAEVVGGTLTLKLMIRRPDAPTKAPKYLGHGKCNNVSRSFSLLQPTADATKMSQLAIKLLNQIRPQPEDIRGVGLQLTRLVSTSSPQQSSTGCCDLRSMMVAAKPSSQPQQLASAEQQFPPLPNLYSELPLAESNSATNLDETFPIDLPPASQLDDSVLEALPPEMRDKILRGYTETITPVVSDSAQQRAPFKPLLASTSPGVSGAGDVGRRGRGRGRGRGTGSPNRSPWKRRGESLDSPRKQKQLFEVLPDATETKAKQFELDSKALDTQSDIQQSPDSHIVTTAVEEKLDTIIIENQAQFLTEFRVYLKEWVYASPNGPLDSDLEKVITYFTELCAVDLEAVFIVLCGFRRLTVNQGNTDWCTVFNSLLDRVQSCIALKYKATLPIVKIPV